MNKETFIANMCMVAGKPRLVGGGEQWEKKVGDKDIRVNVFENGAEISVSLNTNPNCRILLGIEHDDSPECYLRVWNRVKEEVARHG